MSGSRPCASSSEHTSEYSDAQLIERHKQSELLDGVDHSDVEAVRVVQRSNMEGLIAAMSRADTTPPAGQKLSICDVGSGNGWCAKYLSEQLKADIKCYDIVPPESNTQSVDAFVAEHNKGSFLPIGQFDGTNIPEDDGSFDAVSCLFVLHHASAAQIPLLRDMVRVAKTWLLILEDLNEPQFVERNRMHDINGVFRTQAEWQQVWVSLGLQCAEHGAVRDGSGPQYFFLLKK
eukprot:SAG31_NODE_1756_length_7343_cov_2.790309_8_plen_233_part_00